jgi:hypothetical protein
MADNKSLTFAENIEIRNMIYTVRDKQVMLDSDLATLYKVTTGRLNEQVKRNLSRFPSQFMFQLTENEYKSLISQIAISNKGRGGRRKLPYAFTEAGIAMLSAVLRSDVAIEVSIKIIDAFVEMRRFLISNATLFERLDRVELKQIETDKKLEEVFDCLASKKEVRQKIFYNGQIYDAFSFLIALIKKAITSIILIDNYVNIDTLNILCKKNDSVDVKILGSGKGSLSNQDIQKFNSQYPNLTVRHINAFHDRFIIIDDKEVYHIGASLKDAGKKSFGATKIEEKDLINSLLSKV